MFRPPGSSSQGGKGQGAPPQGPPRPDPLSRLYAFPANSKFWGDLIKQSKKHPGAMRKPHFHVDCPNQQEGLLVNRDFLINFVMGWERDNPHVVKKVDANHSDRTQHGSEEFWGGSWSRDHDYDRWDGMGPDYQREPEYDDNGSQGSRGYGSQSGSQNGYGPNGGNNGYGQNGNGTGGYQDRLGYDPSAPWNLQNSYNDPTGQGGQGGPGPTAGPHTSGDPYATHRPTASFVDSPYRANARAAEAHSCPTCRRASPHSHSSPQRGGPGPLPGKGASGIMNRGPAAPGPSFMDSSFGQGPGPLSPDNGYKANGPQQSYNAGGPQQSYNGGGVPQQHSHSGRPQQSYNGGHGGSPQQSYSGGGPQQQSYSGSSGNGPQQQSWGKADQAQQGPNGGHAESGSYQSENPALAMLAGHAVSSQGKGAARSMGGPSKLTLEEKYAHARLRHRDQHGARKDWTGESVKPQNRDKPVNTEYGVYKATNLSPNMSMSEPSPHVAGYTGSVRH